MTIMSDEGNATLVPELPLSPDDFVTFDYNPAAIVISHSAPVTPSKSRSKNTQSGTDGTSGAHVVMQLPTDAAGQQMANGFTTIGVRSVTLDGPLVVNNCLRLLRWTHFAALSGSPDKDKLPQLKFIWGLDQIYLVELTQVTINYTRFSRIGRPVRAQVDLTMHSLPDIPGPTNPTSGGLSGRRSHLLTGAETLPELATRYYGGPGRWREIAAANGVEDPLRVRPGTRVYLPSEQEAGQ